MNDKSAIALAISNKLDAVREILDGITDEEMQRAFWDVEYYLDELKAVTDKNIEG